ncbi:condensation domain-containing protein [Gordonia sp. 'Campus']|uniref:condensation domain-containing protein n=1 Tax=Gordonia sp. 'Campus' TaxID=2915824 RepID=UPI001EE4AA09|nr:condensation domain-containing protein [Gordonia sp. 'Campus']
MHVTTIDRYSPAGGELLSWAVQTSAAPRPSPVPPSFNQAVHLAAAGEASTWLAAAFTVDGRVDRAALGLAYRALIDRHGTLRSSFAVGTEGVERSVHDPRHLELRAQTIVDSSCGTEIRDRLREALDAACHPFGPSAYLLAAIDRDHTSTIICGFDHCHVDAYSISIVIDDLHRLYDGFRRRPGSFDSAELPMTGDFVDFCDAESQAAPIGPGDPRMRGWLRFFDDRDGALPTFPLDLGVAVGEIAPQASEVRTLLGPAATARFDDLCRRNGSSLFGGTLAAMADAVRRCGGGPELALLFPMHTRRDEQWRNAVGWFTTNAPLRVVSTGDLVETIRRVGPDLRRAVRLGEVPVPQVIAAMSGLRHDRADIFMVSYVDYRLLPGARRHAAIDAHHISNATTADDAQFWISRTDQGLAIRTRHPDTLTAHRTIRGFVDEVVQTLRVGAAFAPSGEPTESEIDDGTGSPRAVGL